MSRFAISRLLSGGVSIIGISMLSFLLVAMAPGNPVDAELRAQGLPASPEAVAARRRELGLDRPLPQRYVQWSADVLRFDFGVSIASGRLVRDELSQALPVTLRLAVLALLFIVALSVSSGVFAAAHPDGVASSLLQTITVAISSAPAFLLALVVLTGLARISPLPTATGDGSIAQLVLPSLLLALAPGLTAGRLLRQRILDERVEEYVRFAVILGRTPAQILVGDLGRVVAPTLLTVWSVSFGYLVGGSVVIERVFDLPGLGSLALRSISSRDYPLLQIYLLCCGVLFVAVNAATDLAIHRLDARARRRLVDA